MDYIEFPLCRLHDAVSRFIVPSAALYDIGVLKAQIELRQLALEDIEVIRCRLRPFMRCEVKRRRRGLQNRGGSRSRLAHAFRAGRGARRFNP
jgi:hypothetical protein